MLSESGGPPGAKPQVIDFKNLDVVAGYATQTPRHSTAYHSGAIKAALPRSVSFARVVFKRK